MESSDISEGADVRNSEGVPMMLEEVAEEVVNSVLRRSTRSTAGQFLSKKFIDVFCSTVRL